MNRHENQARSYLMIRLPVKWIAFFILGISLIASAATIASIVFETNEKDVVTQFRSGKLPEVTWVESCF